MSLFLHNFFQTKFYRSSHNYGKALEFDSNGFKKNLADRDVVVYIVWGLGHRDMSDCHFSDELCEGVQRYDETFNPNTPEAQVALLVICSLILSTHYSLKRAAIRRDKCLMLIGHFVCFHTIK